MKQFFKSILNNTPLKNLLASSAAQEAKKYTIENPLDSKESAAQRKEPWVTVVQTHVNPENPRNGFFELDWNEYFVLMLKQNGYQGSTEEEVVNQWFNELCRTIGEEEGVSMDRRGAGYINVNNLGNGRSEIG